MDLGNLFLAVIIIANRYRTSNSVMFDAGVLRRAFPDALASEMRSKDNCGYSSAW